MTVQQYIKQNYINLTKLIIQSACCLYQVINAILKATYYYSSSN